MVEFKDRLELALQIRNMKPADLSRLTGIGEGAISQYRKGAYKATQRNLEKISKVLDVSIPWLMGAEDEKGPTHVSESRSISPERKALLDAINDMDDDTAKAVLDVVKSVKRLRGE